MTDRELLTYAAKAAGEDVEWHDSGSYFYRKSCNWPAEKGFFNPLHDDGEALRLAVELRFDIAINLYGVDVFSGELDDFIRERCRDGDAANATRRAIVRAAAAIGRAM